MTVFTHGLSWSPRLSAAPSPSACGHLLAQRGSARGKTKRDPTPGLLLLTAPARRKHQWGKAFHHLSAFIRAALRKSSLFCKEKMCISRQPCLPSDVHAARLLQLGERTGTDTKHHPNSRRISRLVGVGPTPVGGAEV